MIDELEGPPPIGSRLWRAEQQVDHLFKILRELVEASKDYASSDPTLLTHDGVEFRFDAALEAAEEALR